MDKEPITVEGLEKLKLELNQLKNIKRPQIVAAIAEARSHGDLKENYNGVIKIKKNNCIKEEDMLNLTFYMIEVRSLG